MTMAVQSPSPYTASQPSALALPQTLNTWALGKLLVLVGGVRRST